MPKVLSCRRSCHAQSLVMPKVWSCRRSRHAQSLVILSNAKDLRGEASGLPGRPEQPCSRMRDALCRAGIRASSPGRSFGLRPQDDKDRVGGAFVGKTPRCAQGDIGGGSQPMVRATQCPGLVMPKVLSCRRSCHARSLVMPKVLSCPKSCHPEQREGSAQRSIGPAGPPGTAMPQDARRPRPCGHPRLIAWKILRPSTSG